MTSTAPPRGSPTTGLRALVVEDDEPMAGLVASYLTREGYEVQVNNSHTDWRRTGSLYAIEDVKEVYVKDNEWYTESITVKDKHITIKINDKTVVDYVEPDNVKREAGMEQRVLSSGTFALQGHDPKSKVYFRKIMVKPLD